MPNVKSSSLDAVGVARGGWQARERPNLHRCQQSVPLANSMASIAIYG